MCRRLQGSGVATGLPLLDSLVGLGAGAGLSTSSLLLYASAATGAYAVWEQLRFHMARCVQGRLGVGAAAPGGGAAATAALVPPGSRPSLQPAAALLGMTEPDPGCPAHAELPGGCVRAPTGLAARVRAGGARMASWCRAPAA